MKSILAPKAMIYMTKLWSGDELAIGQPIIKARPQQQILIKNITD